MNPHIRPPAPFPSPRRRGVPVKKRVLIVNTFMDDRRRYTPYPYKVPQAMGPAMLAGGFSPTACDVRIYSEHHSGPLQDPARLGWPDLLVLTGLTSSFDRMRHLTAYARTLNPRVIVAAGGPPIRALPRYARRFFDYVCEGDVEQIRDVVRDAWGAGYTADPGVPRYDLISQHYRFLGYLESSRHCNFRCQFCSLTGENARYRKYDLETLRRQFQALGKKKYLLFIDNNFYGNDRRFFLDRLELLKEFREQGFFQAWSALVTDDFFLDETNLARVKESGCYSLFSGVESFDPDVLRGYHKTQNTIVPQVESIRKCLEAGIVFHYGIMFDPARRPLENLRRELEFILDTPGLPLPSFFTLSIPLPGTPYFQECVSERRLLPRVKMRDLDGFTLVSHPRDPMERVVPFVRDLETLRGYRARVIRKAVQLIRAYHRRLTPFQLWLAIGNAFLLCAPSILNAPGQGKGSLRPKPRTYVSTTEPLDPLYDPMIRVDSRYESYFHPTWVTDEAGELSSPFREDYETDGRRRSRSLEETAPGENPFRGPALFPEVMSSGARTALHRAAALGGPVLGPFFGFQGG